MLSTGLFYVESKIDTCHTITVTKAASSEFVVAIMTHPNSMASNVPRDHSSPHL